MREIEVKVRVADSKALAELLKDKGVELSEPVQQRDQVFGPDGVNGDAENDSPWLRIRSESLAGKTIHIFTLKRSITNQMDSIEHETEITDPEELKRMIYHLGFMEFSDLTKTRQTGEYEGIGLCLDSIDELGDFLEVERLVGDDETVTYESVIEELWRVLETFGMKRSDAITDGYDVLMRKAQGVAKSGV